MFKKRTLNWIDALPKSRSYNFYNFLFISGISHRNSYVHSVNILNPLVFSSESSFMIIVPKNVQSFYKKKLYAPNAELIKCSVYNTVLPEVKKKLKLL